VVEKDVAGLYVPMDRCGCCDRHVSACR
jgi:hypothetical protein